MTNEPIVIDLHTHIFPPEIIGARERFFQGEPAFQLLYANRDKSPLATAEDLISYLDRFGIRGAVTFGFPWKKADLIRRTNDYVLEAVSRYPDRLLGFACLNPELSDALPEAERCLRAGLKGIGELALYGSALSKSWGELFRPLARLAADWQVPLMLHTNEPLGHRYPGKERLPAWEVYDLIKAHRDTKFILAHWGGGVWFYQLLKREVREVFRRVYVDTAASPFLYRPEIYHHALDILGSDRILFGSDFPLLAFDRYERDMEAAGIASEERWAILGGNARKLLAWPSP